MKLADYKACICEGSAENAIIDILLDYGLLIFDREELIEEKVIRCRDGRKFEEKYLRKGFKYKISIIRILDSRRENFKISKAYVGKVDIINVVTAPLKYFHLPYFLHRHQSIHPYCCMYKFRRHNTICNSPHSTIRRGRGL